ncbi:hypothetical protein PA598K_05738 [Paenibacillus sp. 598K]|nr:hypothetical protein PA598K_05738 [Paenibacillus sp. 598K]
MTMSLRKLSVPQLMLQSLNGTLLLIWLIVSLSSFRDYELSLWLLLWLPMPALTIASLMRAVAGPAATIFGRLIHIGPVLWVLLSALLLLSTGEPHYE